MEAQYQKIVNISYLAFSALVAFILLVTMMKISSTYDLESKIRSIEFVIRGLSLLGGGVLFAVLYKNSKVNSFMNEVVVELLTKVVWPNGRETMIATVVVVITVIIAGIILAVFDWLWVLALKAVL
ncbi:MAG: preprotein translocase subunit SecE [Bacteriovoracia bacterium]